MDQTDAIYETVTLVDIHFTTLTGDSITIPAGTILLVDTKRNVALYQDHHVAIFTTQYKVIKAVA
jgi:hypothetical protein